MQGHRFPAHKYAYIGADYFNTPFNTYCINTQKPKIASCLIASASLRPALTLTGPMIGQANVNPLFQFSSCHIGGLIIENTQCKIRKSELVSG